MPSQPHAINSTDTARAALLVAVPGAKLLDWFPLGPVYVDNGVLLDYELGAVLGSIIIDRNGTVTA